MKRRVVHRKPPEVLELDRQVDALQSYLYNFWLTKIKRLAVTEHLPIEFFQKKYEQELEVQIRKHVEQIYIARIKSLEKKLVNIAKTKRRSKTASFSDIFTSIKDIFNIKKITTTVKDKFFASAGRLVGRISTSRLNPSSGKVEIPTPFDEKAAFNRVGGYGGYSAFNTATTSKLDELTDELEPGTGVPSVQYVTEQDELVCPICEPFDGEVFAEDDPSIPDIPQHDNCRCFLDIVE